jgi:hypothetical protein
MCAYQLLDLPTNQRRVVGALNNGVSGWALWPSATNFRAGRCANFSNEVLTGATINLLPQIDVYTIQPRFHAYYQMGQPTVSASSGSNFDKATTPLRYGTDVAGSFANAVGAVVFAFAMFDGILSEQQARSLQSFGALQALLRGRPRRIFAPGAAAGATTDTALSTTGAATATLVGAARLATTLSATGAAVGTLVGDVAGAFGTADLSTAGAAVGTLVGAARVITDLSAAGAAVGTGATASLAAAVLSSTGAATGTLEGTVASNVVSSWLDTTGAATATATGASRVTSDLDADGAATATGATASIITANLSAAGAALGTLEGSAVSGYETADLSAAGTATGTMAGAAIIGAALSAAGAAVARLSTVEPSTDNAYLTWGAEARRVRQLQEEDDEEILTMLASMMPAIRRSHGKSNSRSALRRSR